MTHDNSDLFGKDEIVSKKIETTPVLNPIKQEFDKARKMFPGKKRGLGVEYANFVKRSTKPAPDGVAFTAVHVVNELVPAIQYQIRYREWAKAQNKWMPEWKNFQTWINKMCWEEEYPEFQDVPATTVISDEAKEKFRLAREKVMHHIRNER